VAATRTDVEAPPALPPALARRLKLDAAKLDVLAGGARQLARRQDPLGKVLERRELDEGLVLEQVRAPLGVLAVVFESRPDALVQIASLALRSANALVLKAGPQAREPTSPLT